MFDGCLVGVVSFLYVLFYFACVCCAYSLFARWLLFVVCCVLFALLLLMFVLCVACASVVVRCVLIIAGRVLSVVHCSLFVGCQSLRFGCALCVCC